MTLSDGAAWLLAPLSICHEENSTTSSLNSRIDKVFEDQIENNNISVDDIIYICIKLLQHNYDLYNCEIIQLLNLPVGEELDSLAEVVVGILFGFSCSRRSYTRWVRASLLANGLADGEYNTDDLHDVLLILLATNRTVPLAQFADVCKEALTKANLDSIV